MVTTIVESLKDTLKMVPILFLVYLALEYVEARWQQRMVDAVERAGKLGPVVASVGGAIPQCGFSVMASALYTERLLTIGTIVAVYLATSDEALPILLSKPGQAHVVLPLVGIKAVLAVTGGYFVDLVMRSENGRRTEQAGRDRQEAEREAIRIGEQNCTCEGTRASCVCEQTGVIDWKEILWSAAKRTVQIFLYLLATSIILGLLMSWIGQANLSRLLLSHTVFQPVVAAVIGLIPNCAASVAITELYMIGTLSFGSAIAGLGAAGGLGLIVLFRENHDPGNTAKVIAWLLGISIAAGILVQLLERG